MFECWPGDYTTLFRQSEARQVGRQAEEHAQRLNSSCSCSLLSPPT